MKISREGLALIKRWEGCRLEAYQDSVGVWTIGYGITTNAGLGPIKKGMKITQAQADEWLLAALAKYERTVQECLNRTPTQAQYDAMVSLCYNIGQGAFAKSSLVRRFNAGDIAGAADAFLMWVKAGGVTLKGLQNRRADERRHFLKAGTAAQPDPAPKPATPATDTGSQPTAPEKPGKGLAAVIGSILAAAFAALVYWITQGSNP